MNTVLLNSLNERIGRILRLYREKTGHNQSEIAQQAGISVSMLSQIERGTVAPSIETLIQVCSVLDIDPSELFRQIGSQNPVRIHRKGERLRNTLKGVEYEQLMTSNHPTYLAEMFLIEVSPGKSTTFSGGGHEGAEMGYVLSGGALLTVDTEEYRINEGDSIYFNAQLPHRLANRGKGTFRAIWSISPPHVDFLGLQQQSGENNRPAGSGTQRKDIHG
jgi:transcriptional regulator with XRE-family HTH domain